MKRLLVLAVLAAGCGDGVAGPGPGLQIDDVSPVPFGPGDTVEVRGPSVGRAVLTLDGAVLEPVQRGSGFLRFQAPFTAACGEPVPPAHLVLSLDGLDDEITVPVYAEAVPLDLAPGEHTLLPITVSSCGVALLEGGTYGVAVFRTAPVPVTMDDRTLRVAFGARIRGGGPSPEDAVAVPARIPPITTLPASPRPHDIPPNPPNLPEASVACQRQPLAMGDRIPLTTPWSEDVALYEVVSTSDHFTVLAEADSLPLYPEVRRAAAAGFAAALEAAVFPFLERVFASWPDTDGDGKLNVLFGGETAASYSGGRGIYTDGCEGDFIRLAHWYLDQALDAELNNPLGVVVHEAMHWYDIGPDLSRNSSLQDWSIEGVAELAQTLWKWERDGRDPWANDGLACPPGSTCIRRFLQAGRFGWPGLSREGGYGHGMYLALYLVQQALPEGASLLPALGRLRARGVALAGGAGELRSPVALQQLFAAAGGESRTEAELQGEYLLSYWADDFVSGISPRIAQPAWDLSENGPDYPLRAFRLDGGNPGEDFALALPDGLVFEVAARDGATLFLLPAGSDVSMAIVRGR